MCVYVCRVFRMSVCVCVVVSVPCPKREFWFRHWARNEHAHIYLFDRSSVNSVLFNNTLSFFLFYSLGSIHSPNCFSVIDLNLFFLLRVFNLNVRMGEVLLQFYFLDHICSVCVVCICRGLSSFDEALKRSCSTFITEKVWILFVIVVIESFHLDNSNVQYHSNKRSAITIIRTH